MPRRPLEWEHVHPAKGSGGHYLLVGPLELVDSADSRRLPALVAAIEQRIGQNMPRHESYDC